MRVLVNGLTSEFADESSVGDVVTAVAQVSEGRGVAVAVNGEVVPRHLWHETSVGDGDRIEVLRAVGGG